MVFKKNKSESYQYKIIEIVIDPSILNEFSIDQGFGQFLNIHNFSEKFYELKQELMDEVLRIIDEKLTQKQKDVIKLRLKGFTQFYIGTLLNRHQTTVHKILNGNVDYKNSKKSNVKKRYGGIIKKLKKLCLKDPKIISILNNIKIFKEDDE